MLWWQMQHACKHDKGEVTHKYQQFIREERTISNTEMRIRLIIKKNLLTYGAHIARSYATRQKHQWISAATSSVWIVKRIYRWNWRYKESRLRCLSLYAVGLMDDSPSLFRIEKMHGLSYVRTSPTRSTSTITALIGLQWCMHGAWLLKIISRHRWMWGET